MLVSPTVRAEIPHQVADLRAQRWPRLRLRVEPHRGRGQIPKLEPVLKAKGFQDHGHHHGGPSLFFSLLQDAEAPGSASEHLAQGLDSSCLGVWKQFTSLRLFFSRVKNVNPFSFLTVIFWLSSPVHIEYLGRVWLLQEQLRIRHFFMMENENEGRRKCVEIHNILKKIN